MPSKEHVAVVTGATSGIGMEIAIGLARDGFTVVMPARDEAKARAVAAEISKQTGNANIEMLSLDVSKQASIAAFIEAFTARHQRLDVLVNNAGAGFDTRRESADGIELTWATNVLGPFLLVKGLQKTLRQTPGSRVVNIVSSMASGYVPDDVEFKRRRYKMLTAYGQSKQALRMLTWWQARQLEGVTVNAVDPGFIRTSFFDTARGPLAVVMRFLARTVAASPAKGAETPLWVATAPELSGTTGRFFVSKKEKNGGFTEGIDELIALCEQMVVTS